MKNIDLKSLARIIITLPRYDVRILSETTREIIYYGGTGMHDKFKNSFKMDLLSEFEKTKIDLMIFFYVRTREFHME